MLGEGYIDSKDNKNSQSRLILNAKGYKRLSEIEKIGGTNNCFVAMWFTPEMHTKLKQVQAEYQRKNEQE